MDKERSCKLPPSNQRASSLYMPFLAIDSSRSPFSCVWPAHRKRPAAHREQTTATDESTLSLPNPRLEEELWCAAHGSFRVWVRAFDPLIGRCLPHLPPQAPCFDRSVPAVVDVHTQGAHLSGGRPTSENALVFSGVVLMRGDDGGGHNILMPHAHQTQPLHSKFRHLARHTP